MVAEQAVDFDEIEANGFAAELLMPTEVLERELQGTDLDYEDDELTRRLANRYEVSLQAMAIRLGNLRRQD